MSDKFTIQQCEKMAKDADASDRATFDLVGPYGRLSCRWLDAYMGLFIAGDSKGFSIVRQVPDALWCENFATPPATRSKP